MQTESIIHWISLNPQWSILIIFLVAFLESLIILSLFVPGWLLLVGFGTLIGGGILDFKWMVLASFLGAVLGEGLGYYLGWHYRNELYQLKWFQTHQSWLQKSQNFFARHGAASVAMGRFFGPVRAFIPLIAGISKMPPVRFTLINIFSAMIWAPTYLMPGIIAGAAIQIDRDSAFSILTILVVLTVLLWLLVKELVLYFNDKTSEKNDIFLLNVPLPLFKAIIVLISFSLVIKIFYSSSLFPQFAGIVRNVIDIISH